MASLGVITTKSQLELEFFASFNYYPTKFGVLGLKTVRLKLLLLHLPHCNMVCWVNK